MTNRNVGWCVDELEAEKRILRCLENNYPHKVCRRMLCYTGQVSGLDVDKVTPKLTQGGKVLTEMDNEIKEMAYWFVGSVA